MTMGGLSAQHASACLRCPFCGHVQTFRGGSNNGSQTGFGRERESSGVKRPESASGRTTNEVLVQVHGRGSAPHTVPGAAEKGCGVRERQSGPSQAVPRSRPVSDGESSDSQESCESFCTAIMATRPQCWASAEGTLAKTTRASGKRNRTTIGRRGRWGASGQVEVRRCP